MIIENADEMFGISDSDDDFENRESLNELLLQDNDDDVEEVEENTTIVVVVIEREDSDDLYENDAAIFNRKQKIKQQANKTNK